MKGDFSRFTNQNAIVKHYNQVLKQQGRVQLDSDFNELNGIIQHQRLIRTQDIIGNCGAPLHNDGYQILDDGSNNLFYTSGRFYVNGLLCETNPSSRLPIRGFVRNSSTLVEVDDLNI